MIPQPGKKVRGSKTGRPIMALLDLLGRRWILRILWEVRDTPLGFRALQARCDRMSPSVLSQRLNDLTAASLLEQQEGTGDYQLTPRGKELLAALTPLNTWADRWAKRA